MKTSIRRFPTLLAGLALALGGALAASDRRYRVARREQSAAAHSLTIHRPLRIRHISERRYSVDGSPTDCVLLAVEQILIEHKPDLVLSGVNRGGNTGEDVTYSGTVAAAMEATLLGRRGIAARAQRVTVDRGNIQGAILSIAAESGIGMLVMGGFGHSRMQERILGGVTRDMFAAMTVPVLMSH